MAVLKIEGAGKKEVRGALMLFCVAYGRFRYRVSVDKGIVYVSIPNDRSLAVQEYFVTASPKRRAYVQ